MGSGCIRGYGAGRTCALNQIALWLLIQVIHLGAAQLTHDSEPIDGEPIVPPNTFLPRNVR